MIKLSEGPPIYGTLKLTFERLKNIGIGPDICELILCALQEFTSQYGGEKHLASMGVYWWVLAVLQGGEDRVVEYRLAKKKRQGHVSESEVGSELRGTGNPQESR